MQNHSHISLVGTYQGKIPDGTVGVDNDRDYVSICRRLREGEKGDAWVRNRAHFEWLKAYVTLIQADASFAVKTPRLLLAEAWGVTISQWLDDEAVTSQHLLDLEIPKGHPDDFARTAMMAVLGGAFACDTLDEKSLVAVVSALTSPAASDMCVKYPVLKLCLQDACEAWRSAGQRQWLDAVSKQLQSDPGGLHRDLTYYLLLGSYPEKMLEFKVAPQQAHVLRSMDRKALAGLPLHLGAKEESADQIKTFFAEIGEQVAEAGSFIKLLKATSGLLAIEFELLRQVLAAGKFPVTSALTGGIEDHFNPGRAVPNVKFWLLHDLVVPPKPSALPEASDWKWDDWLAWCSQEYLPYRAWQQKARRFDQDIEKAVGCFSDWYVSEYENIHAHPERSLVHALSNLSESVKRDKVSLIYVVDCCPAAFWGLLREAFVTAGFHRHQSHFVCAPLPTVTDVCKPLLIAGEWGTEFSSYEKAVAHRAKQAWPGKQVRYLGGDLNALRLAAVPDGESVFVLNYLHGDEILHADVHAAGSTYEEELARVYARLADVAKEVFEQSRVPADQFGVYVLSDHGATMILPEETETIDSGVMKKLFPDEKHRFAAMEDGGVQTVPENLWGLGYKFKQAFKASTTTYFIPRGHNTIRGGVPKGHVHGGATPEEVLVPVMTWRPVSVAWKRPAMRFVGLDQEGGTGVATFYIKRMIVLKLEIQNPNSQPMTVRSIGIEEPAETEVRFANTGTIPAGQTLGVEIQCSFGAGTRTCEELAVRIDYTVEDTQASATIGTAALFKSAMTGGFSLKDL